MYTTKTSTKGNAALDYPIGLITADEVVYAGGVSGKTNSNYYLRNAYYFWTMSPYCFGGGDASVQSVGADGSLYGIGLNNSVGWVRPVINLAYNVQITSGNGTKTNPYVIKTN